MRFWICWLLLLSLGIPVVKGCEICGCGIGGSLFGLLTQNRKSYFGTRFHSQTFRVHHPPSFSEPELPEHFSETFSQGEIWGMITAGKHLRIITVLPYRSYVRHTPSLPLRSGGIGDVSLSGQYTIAPKPDSAIKPVTWWINTGAGLVLPTGKHQVGSTDLLPAQLPGSGTWQATAFLNGTIRYRNIGVIGEADWRNPFTREGYQQESRRIGLSIFRNVQVGTCHLLPFTGPSYYWYSTRNGSAVVPDYLWNVSAGVQLNARNVIVGFLSDFPVYQRFSNGAVDAMPRWQIQAGYTF